MKLTVNNFWHKFAADGFVCQGCHVIIDLMSPGRARLCAECRKAGK